MKELILLLILVLGLLLLIHPVQTLDNLGSLKTDLVSCYSQTEEAGELSLTFEDGKLNIEEISPVP